MKALKYPIITIVIFLAFGIIAGNYFKPLADYLYVFTALSAIAVAAAYWQSARSFVQKPYFALAACLFSFALGLLAHALHYAPNHTSHYSHYIDNSEIPVITGTISERLKPNQFSEKYYFEVSSINNKPATGKLLIISPKESLNRLMHAGQQLLIADNLQPIARAMNPYQFDYSDYMASQNVFHQVKLKENYHIVAIKKTLDYYVDELRNTLTASFSIHNYSPSTLNMIKALLLGQRQDMDKETTDNYTSAGVVHILAISGLHIAVLFYILNLLLKPLNRLKKGKLIQLLIVLGFLWLFALVSGLSASVVRSVVMFSFVSIGVYFNRDSNIYNSLAVSMLFLLLLKPMFLFDVGFQLSYAAVFAIVWLQPLYKKVRVSRYKAINYMADTVLISLVAQIGVLPLSLYYFNQFPLLFLLANVVVVPLSTVVLIIGIVVLALNFIWTDAAILIGKLLEWTIDGMDLFIAWIASFKSMVLTNIPFTLALNVVLYCLLAAFVLWLYKKSYRRTVACLLLQLFFRDCIWQHCNQPGRMRKWWFSITGTTPYLQ